MTQSQPARQNFEAVDFTQFRQYVEEQLQTREERLVDRANFGDITEAAVLLPLVVSEDLWLRNLTNGSILDNVFLLLEKRSRKMSKSPGDMAFAGGKSDPEDADLIATAYREASEEVGINEKDLHFISYMDEFVSTSSYVVRTVVCWLIVNHQEGDFRSNVEKKFKPLTGESDNTVVVPLRHLMEPSNYSHAKYDIKNQDTTRRYGYLRYFDIHEYLDKTKIWGLTASMIRRFIDTVFPNHQLPAEPNL